MTDQIRFSMASSEEILSAIVSGGGLEVLSKDFLVVKRQIRKGRNQPKVDAHARMSQAPKLKALKLYANMSRRIGNLSPELEAEIESWEAKLENPSGLIERGIRKPSGWGPGPELPITWRNTNPKDRERGRWQAYVLVPLNLYATQLQLTAPVRMPGTDRYRSQNAIGTSYFEDRIVIHTDKTSSVVPEDDEEPSEETFSEEMPE